MNPLEHVGALYIENQRLLNEYRKLLELLQRAKNGEVRLEHIQVDLAKVSWAIVLTGEQFKAAVTE